MVERQYSLFISYADADREWVTRFLIPEIGLPPDQVLTTQGFTPGAYAIEEFERAVEQSRYSLLVFSPAYLEDTTNRLGEKFASYVSAEGQPQRLIPLVLRDCELPTRINARVRLNCTSETQWRSEAARVRDLLNQPAPEEKPVACPYPGLMAYSQSETGSFFGREDELRELAPRLIDETFLLIFGRSGSGKSSFVNAGLIPELLRIQPQGWLVRGIRPGTTPQAALETAVHDLVDLETCQPLYPAGQRLLLVLDPFEEVFLQAPDQEREKTFETINRLRTMPACLVVLVIRSDFYGDLQGSAIWPVPANQRFDIVPLRGDGLRRAIRKPAESQGVYLESSLVERLVGEAAREPGALPLIQETLAQLWDSRMQFYLPLSAYERLGGADRSGLEAAISRKAEAVFARLEKDQQRIARRVFLRLVQFGEGRDHTRRQQPFSNLAMDAKDVEPTKQVIQLLAAGRLLSLSGEEGGEPKADLAHEALISGWLRLHDWITEYQNAEQVRRRLAARAADWEREDRRGGLLDRLEIIRAQEWLASPAAQDIGVGADINALVEASRKADRKNRLRGWLAPVGAVVGAALLALAAWMSYTTVLRGQAAALNPTVTIQGGTATIGDASGQLPLTSPVFHVTLPAFDLEIHEVTNDQFCLCRKALACSGEPAYDDHKVCDKGREREPVTKIKLQDASRFCDWLGGRLPTELEWEWAARGKDNRLYPTGNEPPATGEVNIRAVGVAPGDVWPVDHPTKDITPDYGVQDMAGNVREWTISWYVAYGSKDYQTHVWPVSIPGTDGYVAVRGGSYNSQSMVGRSSNRSNTLPGSQPKDLGFRCLLNLPLDRFQQEVKYLP